MDTLLSTDFWIGLFQIIWIDVVLSGDNAVVIALAARALPPAQQRRAILWGTGFAVLMRVLLAVVAAQLMQLPLLQILGGLLLLWIGLGLLQQHGAAHGTPQGQGSASLWMAIRTILLADMVMCLDNVIAVAAAARGHIPLLVCGLAISIPLVVFGSTLMIRLMERWPWIIWLGAGLIGWVAGETAANDQLLAGLRQHWHFLPHAAAAAGALLVLGLSAWRQRPRAAPPPPRS